VLAGHHPLRESGVFFDLQKAFAALDGRSYSLRDFRQELGRIRWEYLMELPADYGVSELLGFARAQQWFTEDESGTLHVRLARHGSKSRRVASVPKHKAEKSQRSKRAASAGSQRR